jgi:hypothetical protein
MNFPFWTKKIPVPVSNEIKEIDAIQLWEVRWSSRHGSYSTDTKFEMEAFPSKNQAEEFAQALRNAFKLIKHTSGNDVTVTKGK